FAALEDAMAGYADVIGYSKCGESRRHYYAVFPDQERALQVREELLPAFGDKVSIFVNGQHINIGNRGTGKAEGVSFVLRHFALPDDAAAVVGDDYNDLDMILRHNGWAVAGGRPEVVAQAPHVCESVGALIDDLFDMEHPI
ncbi:MAG: HAD hydrolase family protein, partial [Clostridia bacterium]|nr:HAD hydrolase family protein [Clostridia bacterium]